MRKLLVLAIVLRLLVSAFFFHPDIKTYNFQASFFKKGILNIYSYLEVHKKELPIKEEFVYFPLTYLFLGSYQALVSPLMGADFDHWLFNAETNSVVKSPYIFKYLVTLKLPYLLIDILIAYLLMEFFKDSKNKKSVWQLWLFNPFTIILIYVFSNVDIIVVALTLLGLLAARKGKLKYAAVIIGIAAGFKLYPILLLPFLILMGKNLKERFYILLLPAIVILVTILPFISGAFINSAVVSGLSTRLFYPGIPIGFNETIIVGLSALAFLVFWAYLNQKKYSIHFYWLSSLLLIFSFAHFHISWLLWAAPFMAIFLIKKPKMIFPVVILIVLLFTIPFLYDDRSMSISLLRVYSTLYDILPTPFSLVQRFYDPYSLQSILHSVVAGISLVIISMIFKKKETL